MSSTILVLHFLLVCNYLGGTLYSVWPLLWTSQICWTWLRQTCWWCWVSCCCCCCCPLAHLVSSNLSTFGITASNRSTLADSSSLQDACFKHLECLLLRNLYESTKKVQNYWIVLNHSTLWVMSDEFVRFRICTICVTLFSKLQKLLVNLDWGWCRLSYVSTGIPQSNI